MDAATPPIAPEPRPRRFFGAEKAAALLFAMGKDHAARLLKYLDDEEIRAVARCAADLGTVPKPLLDQMAEEFIARIGFDGDLRGSASLTEDLLTGILPPEQIKQIMADVRSRMNEAVWPRLAELPPPALASYLAKEHPQVAAFTISKTSPAIAAGILGHLPATFRNEVMRRLLSNKVVLEPPVRVLEQVIRDDLLHKIARTNSQTVHARIAEIVNKLDRAEMEAVLESLAEAKPKEAQLVRGLLFTFEDVAKLTEAGRTTLFAEVPAEQVILALRGAPADLRDVILLAVPTRTRRIIEQELASASTVPPKEIAKARRAIADYALELGERGVIELRPESNDAS
jgi:flagellar motor switch protein FliG